MSAQPHGCFKCSDRNLSIKRTTMRNKHQPKLTSEVFLLEAVKTTRHMLETQQLDRVWQLYSVDNVNLLQQKSKLKEIKGNVKRSMSWNSDILYCQRQRPKSIIVHREDTGKGDVRTACWLLVTQPLDVINTAPMEIQVACETSLEENIKVVCTQGKMFILKHSLWRLVLKRIQRKQSLQRKRSKGWTFPENARFLKLRLLKF